LPTGEYTSANQIGHAVMDVSSEGYALYLHDLVEILRGYEDPSNVMNFRTNTTYRPAGARQSRAL